MLHHHQRVALVLESDVVVGIQPQGLFVAGQSRLEPFLIVVEDAPFQIHLVVVGVQIAGHAVGLLGLFHLKQAVVAVGHVHPCGCAVGFYLQQKPVVVHSLVVPHQCVAGTSQIKEHLGVVRLQGVCSLEVAQGGMRVAAVQLFQSQFDVFVGHDVIVLIGCFRCLCLPVAVYAGGCIVPPEALAARCGRRRQEHRPAARKGSSIAATGSRRASRC